MSDSAETIIKKSIRMLNDQEEKERQANILQNLMYYNYEQYGLQKRIQQFIQRKDTDIPYSMTNITAQVIDKKSVVYKKPASRTVGEEDGSGDKFKSANENYTKLTKKKNSRMKVIERRTNLLGRVAVRPFFREDEDFFQYQVVQYFVPLEQEDGVVTKLMYPFETPMKRELYVVWDENEYYITDGVGRRLPKEQQEKFGIKDNEHGYGIVPFSYPFIQFPIETFWVPGGEDIVEANEKVNLGLTLLNYLKRYASFKQGYVKSTSGNLDITGLKMGYNKFMSLSGDGEIGVIDIQANLQQVVDSIKFQIELILNNNNLSINWAGTGSATSGFQLIVENMALLSMWEDMVEIWRENEDDLYQVEKQVADTDKDIGLPDNMHVDFAEVRFPVSKEEQRAQDEWDLQQGFISKVDILKRKSPDTPEEQLKERLIANGALEAEVAREVRATTPPPPGLAERLSGG